MLTLVLTLAMLLSVMVVGAGAATFGDQESITNKEAVDVCTTLNIIGGYEDGTFRPAGNVTRAEMCKMICVALNGGKEPSMGSNLINTFNDVGKDHWAAPYIEYCVRESIVGGVGGGNFNPNGNITGTQAAKMLLVILGYDPAIQGYVGSNTWETNINVDAAKKGLYTDLEAIDASAPLSRDSAAQMIWNALQAYEVEYVNTLTTGPNGTLISQATVRDKVVGENKDKITLLRDKYEVYDDQSAIMTGFSYDDSKNEWTYTFATGGTNTLNVTGNITSDKDYTYLFQHNVKVLYSEKGSAANGTPRTVDKVYGMYPDESTVVASGILDDISKIANEVSKIFINDTEYRLANSVELDDISLIDFNKANFNGAATALDSIDTVNDTNAAAYSFEFIDNTGDSRGDVVVVYPFQVAQIDYLSSSRVTLSNNIGSKDLDDIVLYNGAAEDDWTVITKDDNAKLEKDTIEKADVISGEVTAVRTDRNTPAAVQVNGTWYSIAATMADGCVSNVIKVNNSYDLVVVNGFVFHAEKTQGNVSRENILYVDNAGALNSGLADGVEAKVYFADGTKDTVKVTAITAPVGMKINYSSNAVTYDGSGSDTALEAGDEYDIVQTGAVAADYEINAAAAENILKHYSLYTYSESGGEYSLEPITDNNKGSYDEVASIGSYSGTNNLVDSKLLNAAVTNDGARTVRFDTDAVIFVKDADGVKVVTGATVNSWKDRVITDYCGLVDKSSGNYYTMIGMLKMTGTARTDMNAYGFITSSINFETVNGTKYIYFDMWDGSKDVEHVRVEENNTLRNGLAKYSFVQFSWVDEANKEADDEGFAIKNAANNGVAITAVSAGDIEFSDNLGVKDFADDYYIIGVDTKNGSGEVANSLKVATDCHKDGHSTGDYLNAVYFLDDDGDVEAVFLDTSNILYDDKNGNELCSCAKALDNTASVSDINNALKTADVTVDGATIDSQITVPAGRTLTLKGTITAGSNIVGAAGAKIVIATGATVTGANFWNADGDSTTISTAATITAGDTYVWGTYYTDASNNTGNGWVKQAP